MIRRLLRLTLGAGLAAGALVAHPVPPAGALEDCDGVVVVVDARDAGGSTTARCAPGAPADGLEALRAAGHAVTDVPRVPGMVCTIDRRPDPCNMAPSNAHWSYWYAPPGGTWTYSSAGAGYRTPPPGSVEGWRFGDGSSPPRIDPPAPAAPDQDDGGSGGRSESGGGNGSGGTSGGGGQDGSGAGDRGSNSGAAGDADGGTGDSAGARPGTQAGADAGGQGAVDRATTNRGSTGTSGGNADPSADPERPEAARDANAAATDREVDMAKTGGRSADGADDRHTASKAQRDGRPRSADELRDAALAARRADDAHVEDAARGGSDRADDVRSNGEEDRNDRDADAATTEGGGATPVATAGSDDEGSGAGGVLTAAALIGVVAGATVMLGRRRRQDTTP